MFAFIKKTLFDGSKESFGRTMALPYLVSSLGLGIADGIRSLMHGQSALDAVGTLATIGIAVYTGSKALSIPTTKAQILASTPTPAPETASKAG